MAIGVDSAPREGKSIRFDWGIKSLGGLLFAVTGLVVALGIARELLVRHFGIETVLRDLRHFSLDGELNVATWYSSTLMLGAFLLALAVWRNEHDRRQRPYWLAIGLLMLAMSIDETASFHESFITLLQPLAAYSDFLHFAWVVIGAPFVLLFAACTAPFLLRLERGLAARMVAAGVLFVFGALAMEMIDAAIQVRLGAESVAYRAGVVIEDAFELLGMSLFVATLAAHLDHLSSPSSRWRVGL